MISAKEAYSIVKRNNPEMNLFTAVELEEVYAFSLIPKNLDPDDCFANSAVYTVNKRNKEYKVLSFMAVLGEPILEEIDISNLE